MNVLGENMGEHLSEQFKYVDAEIGVIMKGELEYGPFDDYNIGVFQKDEDGFYRFLAFSELPMTCKMLREAAKKCSNLNA